MVLRGSFPLRNEKFCFAAFASKTGKGATPSWVRIPPCPLLPPQVANPLHHLPPPAAALFQGAGRRYARIQVPHTWVLKWQNYPSNSRAAWLIPTALSENWATGRRATRLASRVDSPLPCVQAGCAKPWHCGHELLGQRIEALKSYRLVRPTAETALRSADHHSGAH